MLCEGKESRGWATDVAAQSGRKAAIILYNIAAQCMGQPVLSQPLQVRQSAFSLIRKDKKNYLIISFLGSLVLCGLPTADCGHDDDLKGVKMRRSLIVLISKFIAIFSTCLPCQM